MSSVAHGKRLIAALLAAAVVGALPQLARGQDSEAQLHYDLGSELYQQRRLDEALEHFLASNRLVPNANVVANIAQIYGLLNRPLDAYNWWETFLTAFELTAEDQQEGRTSRDALAARVAVFDVRTTPESAAGADIFIDRDNLGTVGQAPRRVAVSPGPHRVIARVAGHHDAAREATAVLGQVTEVALQLRPIVGRLVVTSTPEGASVRLGDASEPVGVTPFAGDVPAGPLTVTLSLEGYIEQQRTVTVEENEETELTFALRRPSAEVAVLSVESDPADAVVHLDGDEVGRTPVTLNDLEPGSRLLEIHAAGRVAWATDTLLLEAGAATRVRADLAEAGTRMPLVARWLGYGGGGLVAATGLALGIVAYVERDTFFDTANPTRNQLDRIRAFSITADVLMAVGLTAAAVTLIIDLVRSRAPQSTGTVTVDR